MDIFKKLKLNPDNPRIMTKEQFERLKQKLIDIPQGLFIHKIAYDSSNNYVVLGGNQRIRAIKELLKEGKIELKDEYFADCKDWTDNQKRQWIFIDNIFDAGWDMDMVANKYDDLPLEQWGLDVSGWLNPDQDPNKMWGGMPDFDGTEIRAFRKIIINFDNQENVDKFAELLGQKITKDTKYLWFPFKEKQDLEAMRVKTEVGEENEP